MSERGARLEVKALSSASVLASVPTSAANIASASTCTTSETSGRKDKDRVTARTRGKLRGRWKANQRPPIPPRPQTKHSQKRKKTRK